jgi:hypothetical protein
MRADPKHAVMPMQPAPKGEILIIDEDVGFVMYLGQTLARGGYQPWPARTPREALQLIRRLGIKIDIVIAPPGDGARYLVRTLGTIGPGVPNFIPIVRSHKGTAEDDVIRSRGWDENPRPDHWLRTVRRLLGLRTGCVRRKPLPPK